MFRMWVANMTRLTLEWHLRAIRDGVPDEAYTTGWPEDGRTCDAFHIPVYEVLRSDDPVRYLDAIAHDPTRPLDERNDAAALLDHHIWPESPREGNVFSNAERDDIDVSEWIEAGMTNMRIGPTYFPMRCVSDDCMEGECLADWDILREEDRAVCMVCGTEQPIPEYP